MLPNILQYAGQHPQQRIICPPNLDSAKADKSWPKEKGYHLHLMQGFTFYIKIHPKRYTYAYYVLKVTKNHV